MRFEKWHAPAVVVLFLVIAGLIVLTVDVRSRVSPPEAAIREVLAPFQGGVSALAQRAAEGFRSLLTIGSIREENERLRQEVAVLRTEVRALEELRRENERLRALLDLEERLDRPAVSARVIARSPEQWFSTVTINRGSRAGLRAGLPVINEDGVVGQVANVTPNTAQVLLLVDAKSAVGGVLRATEAPVLVEGISDPGGKQVRVRPLVRDAELAPGDEVVTAGSSIFPKGVPIGVIAEVRRDPAGLETQATLVPYVDFGRLEWLTVLLEPGGEAGWRENGLSWDDGAPGSQAAADSAHAAGDAAGLGAVAGAGGAPAPAGQGAGVRGA